jgi:hypothetical protein
LNRVHSNLVYFTNGNYTDHFENEFNNQNLEQFLRKYSDKQVFYQFDDDAIDSIFIKKQPALFFFRNIYKNSTLMFEKKRLPQLFNKYVFIV